MIAYCGLDCLKCDGYLATQANDDKQIAEVAKKWSEQFHADVKAENVICDGCKAEGRKSFHCANLCKIRTCCVDKKYDTCIQCDNFPCSDLKFVLDGAPDAKENLNTLKR